MIDRTFVCDKDALRRMLDGVASQHEQSILQTHLEACPACCEVLESLTGVDDDQEIIKSLIDDQLDSEFTTSQGGNSSDSNELNSRLENQSVAIEAVLAKLLPTDDPEKIGRFGGYEIMGVVGSGSTGVVLKGYEPALNRYVAIKVLAPHLAISATARQRFAREGQATASVLHPNVVPIHQVAEAQGYPYLVMPYLGSETLQKRLDHSGILDAETIVRVGMQIAAGLAAAHAQGLVHRDIKPANILLEKDTDRVVVTDFGLARASDDANLTMTGIVAGTPPYMSPEQAQGDTLDGRSDLFCLGSVMYAMCTGQSPFQAGNSLGTLRRVTDHEPRPIRDINPKVPDWLARVIAKLQSKTPEARFQSAEQVSHLLQQCLGHLQQPLTTPLPDSLPRPLPTATHYKKRFSTYLIGATMFVLLCTIAFSILALIQTQDWTTPNTFDDKLMNDVFGEGDEKRSVAEQLVMWKEMPVGSSHEERCESDLISKYSEQIQNAESADVAHIKSLWAVQLLPYALGGVDENKAEFLWNVSILESKSSQTDHGLEMKVIHALACARRGFTDDATREIESVIAKTKAELEEAGDGSKNNSLQIQFFGKPRAFAEVLHECYGYRAVIRSINVQTIGGPTSNSDSENSDSEDIDDTENANQSEQEQETETFRDVNFFADATLKSDTPAFDGDLKAVPDRPSLGQADEKYMAVFEVDSNQFVSKLVRETESAELGVAVWKRINTLVPTYYRREIVQFNIQDGRRWAGFFNGGGSNDVGRKGYSLSIAKFTAEEETGLVIHDRPATPRRGTLDWTLVHEMGHYICLRSNAIELFSQEFDGDSRPQPERRKKPNDYPEDGSPKVKGNFVTSYAERTGGDEEVVESFTTFMMVDKLPEGDSLVEQKIRFFHDIPGLVELRAHIQQLRANSQQLK